MRRIFRITKRKYVHSALDGEGARLAGGRWNRPGLPAVYASESRALAALETFVHVSQEAVHISFAIVGIRIPDSVGIEVWKPGSASVHPVPSFSESQAAGSEWLLSRRGAVLEVPSSLIPEERNFLLNPLHPDFAMLEVQPPAAFRFDLRMWR